MARTVSLGVLEQVRIASPCSMRWEEMRAVDGDRIRHCAGCDLDVYNLSGMSREDAESLVLSRAGRGRLCVRMHVRVDGMVLTRDCPVGLRAARLRIGRAAARAVAAVAFLMSSAALSRARDRAITMPGLARVQPFASIIEWIRPPKLPAPAAPAPARIIMGARG